MSSPLSPASSPTSLVLDSSGGQANDAVGLGGNRRIVRNHHYSEVLLAVQGRGEF